MSTDMKLSLRRCSLLTTKERSITMKGMDIPALEIFVAAVEERSLSRAAERENIVTSTVSKRIAELERQLDRVLFFRHGRGVDPTPAGTLLYQHAKTILRGMQAAHAAIHHFSHDGVAKIRLAANPSTLLQFLPRKMGAFLASSKDISVDLIDAHSFDIPRLVVDGSVDLGIYHGRYPAPGVASFPFASDRVGLVVPIGHPLTKRGPAYLEDALDFDFVGYFPMHSLEKFLDYIGASVSRPPTVKLQVSNFETRCNLIREGVGIGVVPEGIAANYLGSMGLELVGLKDDWAQRHFFICVRDIAESTLPCRQLLEFLCPVASEALGYGGAGDSA